MKLLAIAGAALLISGAMAGEPISKYASTVADIHVKTSVLSRNMDALRQISNEFAQSYRFAASEVFYKEPNKLKLVSRAGLIDVTYKINGNTKTVKAGLIHKTIDITHSPGQRQGAMSVGLLTPSWLSLVNSVAKGNAKVNGQTTVKFEAHYIEEPRGTYYTFFIDPVRKYIVRQEQYHGDGKLKMTIHFSDPVKINGVWVPTKTVVVNAQGQQGAETRISIVSVNSGLSDKQFEL
jgi:outer membrane murein-binding lipoprotein Lpp